MKSDRQSYISSEICHLKKGLVTVIESGANLFCIWVETKIRQNEIVANSIETQPQESFKEEMNANQAAEYLHLERGTIYGWVKTKNIPHRRIGKRLYFRRSQLDQWRKENEEEIAQAKHS